VGMRGTLVYMPGYPGG